MGSAVDPDVSLIVVTYNNEAIVEACLRAAWASVSAFSAELLVVDNASTDDTVQQARRAPGDARIIRMEHNAGFAAANNAALAQARGRYVALVNSDAFPDPGAVDLLIRRAEGDPRIGLVGGALRYPSGRRQPSTGNFPSLLGNLGVAFFLHRFPLSSRLSYSVAAGRTHYNEPHRVDWVSGAFCLARPAIGPMPAAGFMYGEDVEWAHQARASGFETWFEPRATAMHLGGGGGESVARAMFRQKCRVEFELRWFSPKGMWAVVGVRIVMAVHAVVRLGLSVVMLPFRPTRGCVAIAEFTALLRSALRRTTRPA